MEIRTLKQRLAEVEGIVRDEINETGEVRPIIYCHRQDGEPILVPYQIQPTATERRAQALKIGVQLRALDVVTYVVVSEVLMKEVGKSEAQIPPSESSDEYTAVLIQAHNVETCLTFLLRIDLAEGKPKLVPLHFPDSEKLPGGTWDNLLMDPSAVH